VVRTVAYAESGGIGAAVQRLAHRQVALINHRKLPQRDLILLASVERK
jgi:hypothetical protein